MRRRASSAWAHPRLASATGTLLTTSALTATIQQAPAEAKNTPPLRAKLLGMATSPPQQAQIHSRLPQLGVSACAFGQPQPLSPVDQWWYEFSVLYAQC